ncbi:hypothetical protein [Xanthomonas phage BUDD]|nr:hypothetical protein [Xanthomonas phage BUDD]
MIFLFALWAFGSIFCLAYLTIEAKEHIRNYDVTVGGLGCFGLMCLLAVIPVFNLLAGFVIFAEWVEVTFGPKAKRIIDFIYNHPIWDKVIFVSKESNKR